MTETLIAVAVLPWRLCSLVGFLCCALPQLAWAEATAP